MSETIHISRDELVRIPPRPGGPRRTHRAPEAKRPGRPLGTLIELLPVGLVSRTRDIVAANFTDLLDRAEDPAKMIRVIILEMEETLVEVRTATARTIADQKEMGQQIARLERLQESWVEKAELALSKGREDLARAALVEKGKAAEVADTLRAETAMLAEAMRASETDIAKLQAKLREARTRQNAIQNRLESANRNARLREMYAGPRVEEAFSRFELLERKVDEAEGRAEALALAPADRLADEIAELRNAEKVEAELDALKSRLGK